MDVKQGTIEQGEELPPLREVLVRHDLFAQKRFGQNFLLDLNLTRKIARHGAVCPTDVVVEVGPGPGGLTRALLLEGARHVIALEKDPRMLAPLEELRAAFPGRLTVLLCDALTVDYQALVAPYVDRATTVKLIANLPYHIATALLTLWITTEPWPPWWSSLILMFQREVAQRIVASPREEAYGRLSIVCQARARPWRLFDLPPQAFTPPPKVVSSVVSFEPLGPGAPSARVLVALERLTRAAFGQRRKMLRTSLKSVVDDPEAFLARRGISGQLRAENLSVRTFLDLAHDMIEGEL